MSRSYSPGSSKARVSELNGGYDPARNGDTIVNVQPPRREDLQPSYARVLKPDSEDDSQHGWLPTS